MQTAAAIQQGFAEEYVGTPPWEIGKPQPAFVAVADQICDPLLDSGCGTGNAALYFASRGLQVTGIDFVEEAIRRARAKAEERALSAEFLVMDAMTLADWDRRFATVIDSGLFHIYSGDNRQRYVAGLAHVLRPGGRLFLLSFRDDAEIPGGGPSREDLYDAFSAGWEIESLETVRGLVSAEHAGAFPDGGPEMWFLIARRTDQ